MRFYSPTRAVIKGVGGRKAVNKLMGSYPKRHVTYSAVRHIKKEL